MPVSEGRKQVPLKRETVGSGVVVGGGRGNGGAIYIYIHICHEEGKDNAESASFFFLPFFLIS